jgi:nicotinate (nicotinamide) nucleotide adenylyltransferase
MLAAADQAVAAFDDDEAWRWLYAVCVGFLDDHPWSFHHEQTHRPAGRHLRSHPHRPPAPGHQRAGAAGAEEVRLLPNYIPPHRATPDSAPAHRLAMARLAATQTPGLVVDDRELRRDRPSYTIETLIELRRELPATPLCFLMGMDSLCSLNSWHRWRELLDHTHLVVSHRPGWEPDFNDDIAALYRTHGTRDAELLHRRPGRLHLPDGQSPAGGVLHPDPRTAARREQSAIFVA